MKVIFILWTADQQKFLQHVAEAEGYEVAKSLQRTPETILASQVENLLGADVLIVDCSGAQQKQDIAVLENVVTNNPNLIVVMLTQTRDADTLVEAMQAGVREVLLSPASAADLSAALRRCAVRKIASPNKVKEHAKVVSFMSCKGGSGATFLATNFAYILAKDFGKKTAFLDLDMQGGDAAYYVSPGPKDTDITDLTQQIDRLDTKLLSASMLHITPNFDLLSAPENPETIRTITALQVERLLKLVMVNYDTVVLDLERALDPLTIKALEMSDVVYVVMENLLPFVRSAKRLVVKFRDLGYEDSKIRIVVNRYEKNGTIDVAEIEKAIDLKVSHTIRSSFKDVAHAINTGVPLAVLNPSDPIAKVLRSMASGFSDVNPERSESWIDRLTRINR